MSLRFGATEMKPGSEPDISIILPCRNEVKFIDACLDSVLNQRVDGYSLEVIVADGMSEDGTRKKLATWEERDARVKVVDNNARIIPAGLNLALAEARGAIVVRLDAHSTYPADYVQNCVNALSKSGADNVGGRVITFPRGTHEGALLVQAVSTHPFGVGGARYRTGALEGLADTVPFGCFRRDLIAKIGAFDERLVRHEDYEFNARIRASGGKIWLDPKIKVEYYNQSDVPGLLRQANLAGRWNVFAWYLAPYSFRARHVIPGVFLLFLVLGGAFALASASWAIVFAAILAVYSTLAVMAAVEQAQRVKRLGLAWKLPFVFFAYHVSYGAGLVSGLFKVLTGRAPVDRMDLPWAGAPATRLRPSAPILRSPRVGDDMPTVR